MLCLNNVKRFALIGIVSFSFIGKVSFATGLSNSESNEASAIECVILLHGLARTMKSMKKMASGLRENSYFVVNIGYPSRKHEIEYLSKNHIPPSITQCQNAHASPIHFVTHSMGGILIRDYLKRNTIEELGNVVMLSPPNKGSEIVDKIKNMPGFTILNGPAGQQLGTDLNSVPNRLGPVDFSLGIITGNRTINPLLSMLIPGDDDGKVSIKRARVEGMNDFIIMPHSHSFIMNQDAVILQTINFLQTDSFEHQ
jgi:triacylglycerol lipase